MRACIVLSAMVAAALSLSACATQKVVLAPTPPVEIRKEPASSPGDAVKEPTASTVGAGPAAGASGTAPDSLRMYSEAISRTKEAFQRGSVKEAIPLWKALEGSQWGTDAIFHQGVILHLAGDLDGAVSIYRRLADRSPIFEPAAANLLGIYLLRGDFQGVRSLVDRILPPGTEPPSDMLPELQSNAGAALVELGEYDRAAGLFLALRKRGKCPPSLSWNMAVMSYRNGDVVTARRMASETPLDVSRLWPVVASRFAWERESGVVPPLDNVPVVERRISALAGNIAAFEEYRKGNLSGAETILALIKEMKSPYTEIISNLGMLQAEQGKWKEARGNIEKAVGDSPGLAEGWLNLGVYREVYEGKPDEALECYRRYVRLNGSRKDEVLQWIDWLQKSSPQQR